MRQVIVSVLASLGLVACGASTGGGGSGNPYGVTPTDTVGGILDVASDTGSVDDTGKVSDTLMVTDTVQPGSLKTCIASSQCAIDACKAAWSATCGQTCANATAKEAAPTASALLDCTTKKCLQGKCAGTSPPTQKCMDDCTASDCPNELVACWEQGGTPGTQGCSTILNCLTGCDSNPQRFTCQAACYNAVNKTGETQFKTLSTCVNANGGKADKCVKESLLCLSDGKTGSGSCYDVQACLAKCATGDTQCQGTCYGNGSATSQTQLLTLMNCVNTSGADKCLGETVTCATPTGSVGCVDTATCVTGCGTGATQAACVMDCLHKASSGGASAFAKLAPCVQKNCPGCTGSACQNCAASKCLSDALNCNSN